MTAETQRDQPEPMPRGFFRYAALAGVALAFAVWFSLMLFVLSVMPSHGAVRCAVAGLSTSCGSVTR